jgi:tetratricopeptide (TPR) repeat protein
MLPAKQISTHLRGAKTGLLLLIVVFALQPQITEAFPEAFTAPAEQHKILKEHGIDTQAVPTLAGLASINVHQVLKYYDLGHWQGAIIAFSDAISVNPNFAVAYFGLGVTYSQLEDWEEALIYFRKTIELSPSFAQGYLGLGVTYNILGMNAEAVKALKKAVLINPRFAQAHYSLGLCHLWNGDQVSALEEYEILKGLDPDLAEHLVLLINKY